jgi:glycerol uptake facilitator-like aquaporin
VNASLSRCVVGEAVGSALLVATVVGSGIMAEQLSGGNVALALLGNTLATGSILVVLILMLQPLSGAHFNPAVSLVFAMRREMPFSRFAFYAGAQLIGAVAGTLLAHAMFAESLLQLSSKVRTGPAQWLAETVATFGLVGTILCTAATRPARVAYAVGLYISAAYWFTSSTSFANPTVTVARSLSDTFAGIRPADVPGFVLAELLGALIAAFLFGWLMRPLAKPATAAESRPGAH